MKTMKKLLAAAMAGTVCLANAALMNVHGEYLHYWGTSAGAEEFSEMKKVDDKGMLRSAVVGQNPYLGKDTDYSVYLEAPVVLSNDENGDPVLYYRAFIAYPGKSRCRAVFEKGTDKDTMLSETASILEEITGEKLTYMTSINTKTNEEIKTNMHVGGFTISPLISDEVSWTDIGLPVNSLSKEELDKAENTILTELNEKGLLTAFYDRNNVYNYFSAEGDPFIFNLDEEDRDKATAINDYLDKNYPDLDLDFVSESEERPDIYTINTEKEVSFEERFAIAVSLYQDFGLVYYYDIPENTDGAGAIVGENALEKLNVTEPEEAAKTATVKNGDVNSDNAVDSKDATALLIKYAEALNDDKTLRAEDMPGGDYNGDGKVDSLDATAILIAYAEWLIER